MIIPEGYSQVTFFFSGSPVPLGAAIVFGVQNISDSSPATVATQVRGAWSTGGLRASWSNLCTMSHVLVKNGPNDTGPSADVATTLLGSHADAPGGAQVSMLIGKVSSLGGRRGRGRMYIPAIPESKIDPGGTLDATYASSAQTQATATLSAMLTNNVPMVLLHNDETIPTPVTSLAVSNIVATQRRRQRK